MIPSALTPAECTAILQVDFLSFIELSFYELNPDSKLLLADYIEVIAAKLEDCRLGKCKRLIINLPPRYLKSHCASVAFTAWLLGHNPSTQIICASYGQDLSEKLARDARSIMTSAWYQEVFATRLHPNKQAVNDFMTTRNGGRMATSVGGVLTGRGGDFLIIDDPIKPEDALSETQRRNANIWFDHTLRSRLNNKADGCIIIVMQRLHQDDLVGHVLDEGGWEVLSFPAIAEEDETHVIHSPLGSHTFIRKAAEALHPERETADMLLGIRKTMGEYAFASQYQQSPSPQGGAMVKREWLKYYITEERPATFERIVQSWDTANKAGELNDYSVCTTWGEKNKHYFLLDVFRRRMEYPDLKRSVREQARFHNANIILIEDKASGTPLIQDLKSEGLSGVTPYDPQACEKIMRFRSQTDTFENGRVLLPKEAHWLRDYIHEIITFPGSKHDDQVDSTVQALAWLKTPLPGAGWMEFFNREIKKMRGELYDIRLKFPEHISSIRTFTGRSFNKWQGEIIEVSEEDAHYMYQTGFTKVV